MPFQKGNQYGKMNKGRSLKHGMCGTSLYQCWQDMKQRCDNKSNAFYYRYGGRGITYCNEWSEFEPFYEWAMKSGYRKDLTIDRIDNDGDYTPENCKWSTQHEQSINKTHMPPKSGIVGVRRHGRGYAAEITWRRQYHYVGTFDTIEEALAARNAYKASLQ